VLKRRLCLSIAAVAVALLTSASHAAAIEPHQDPETAPWVFDGVSLLSKYSEVIDYILAGNVAGVESLQRQTDQANVPPDLRETVNRFLSSGRSLAQLIQEMESDTGRARELLEQFQHEEARASVSAAQEKLYWSYDVLNVLEREAQRTGHWWGADSAEKEDTLTSAYQAVLDRLEQLRHLLDLLGEMLAGLSGQVESLTAVHSTSVSLWVEPSAAFVGETVEFGGHLSAGDKPLAHRQVTILLGGFPISKETADSKGIYHGHMTIPYRYVPEITTRAIYYPQEEDVGLYLGSASTEITISVLYYITKLDLQVPDYTFPGRKLTLNGQFDYGNNPITQSRTLQVNWDEGLVATETVPDIFSLEIGVPPESRLGKHQVAVYVSPNGRYNPAEASSEVDVVKLTPVMDLSAPSVVLLPLAQDIHGHVYSSLGVLEDASVKVTLGDWETTSRTRSDGTFHSRLSTGLNLSLLAIQELRVNVTPKEPWHKATSLTRKVIMVNPINVTGLLLVLAVSVVFLAGRWSRKAASSITPATPRPSPPLVQKESHQLPPEPLKLGEQGRPESTLVALYRTVLKLVQGLTAMILGPSYTLREYAQACAPRLGLLAGYFQDLTMMVERLLYSQYSLSQRDIKYGRQLADKIEEASKLRPGMEFLPTAQLQGEGRGEAKSIELASVVSSTSWWRQSATWLWLLLVVTIAYYACVLLFLLPLVSALTS